MRILLIKMSSMGDVIHALPAVSEAQRFYPDLSVDWVVEESCAEIPQWHGAVGNVIVIGLRRWRKNWWQAWRSGEIAAFLHQLRKERYDYIIDAQGLCKSAIIARLARLTPPSPALTATSVADSATALRRCGYDFSTARESLAALFYQSKFNIAAPQHAITRIRRLFAAALGYEIAPPAALPLAPPFPLALSPPLSSLRAAVLIDFDYGIKPAIHSIDAVLGSVKQQLIDDAVSYSAALVKKEIKGRYLLFIHGASRAAKRWSEARWAELAQHANAANFTVLLPWGSEVEQQCAQRIAAGAKGSSDPTSPPAAQVHVLPRLTLTAIAYLMEYSSGVIAVDTGLAHLAAALEAPTLALYGPTQPALIGVWGKKVQHHVSHDCSSLESVTASAVWQDFLSSFKICIARQL